MGGEGRGGGILNQHFIVNLPLSVTDVEWQQNRPKYDAVMTNLVD